MAGNVSGLVFRLERDGPQAPVRVAYISEASQRLVGYSAERLLQPGQGIRSLVHADDEAGYWASQQLALEKSQDWRWPGRILNRDGDVRWADIRASVRGQPDGRQVWDGIVWDITENKRIELELDASRAQLRQLAAHLETVREEEKAHIAREVHDELGQVLTVLKLETSMCELGFAELDPALAQRLDSMKRLIAQLFQRVRDVATALRPPILDAGIASAVERQARRFEERSGVACLVEVPECPPALGNAKAIGLFRILQESLTNVMRHARAQTVSVQLQLEGDLLCLRVSDDGCGFADAARSAGRSFGLVGMRERIQMLGGQLCIDSQHYHHGTGPAGPAATSFTCKHWSTAVMIRVMVAEDHTIVREGIKQLIGMARDMQVVGEAANGQQLLDQLRQISCDVVLLDISMPGVNGLEAIPRIRALNQPPAVLVLSMHDEAQMAARALKIGAAGYATKDSEPALLLTPAQGGRRRALHRSGAGRPHGLRGWPDRFAAAPCAALRTRILGVRTAGAGRFGERHRRQAGAEQQDHQHPQGPPDAEAGRALGGRSGALRHGTQAGLSASHRPDV